MPATKAYPPAKYWGPAPASWNFVYGCTPVGEGCKNCWAKANHERWRGQWKRQWMSAANIESVYRYPFDVVNVRPDRLDMPLRWKKPRVIAVNFSGDTFHEKVTLGTLRAAWNIMDRCPQHTFIILTKRWNRMRAILRAVTYSLDGERDPPLPNVQLGVSVSTQAELDAAMPHLLATPAAVRLLSLEPLLEGMDLSAGLRIAWQCSGCQGYFSGPFLDVCPTCNRKGYWSGSHRFNPPGGQIGPGIDGLIIGCESGPKRRPCKLAWVRSLVEQCQAAGVKCFVKQMAKSTGRVLTDPNEWPESIRVRELPG